VHTFVNLKARDGNEFAGTIEGRQSAVFRHDEPAGLQPEGAAAPRRPVLSNLKVGLPVR